MNWQTRRNLARALFVLVMLVVAGVGARKLETKPIAPGIGKVKDGDSFVLRSRGIRLFGIDAPEYRQLCQNARKQNYECGKEAAKALRELIRGRTIKCKERERDRYRRSVSICTNGEVELNAEMVRQGWAIAYRRHSGAYIVAEREAKQAKRGLWQGKFIMPEDYRNQQRQEQEGVADSQEEQE